MSLNMFQFVMMYTVKSRDVVYKTDMKATIICSEVFIIIDTYFIHPVGREAL